MKGEKSGIYQIRNAKTGRIYVGSSVRIRARWYNHLSELRRGIHQNPKLQYAWNKYGETLFEFSILEECASEILIEREREWMAQLNPFYNINYPEPTRLGMKATAETLAKQRKPRGPMRQAHKDAIRAALIGRPQKKHGPMPQWHKDKIARANLGRPAHSNILQAQALATEAARLINTGREKSESHRRKLAEANTGKVFSEGRRQAISKGRTGIAPEKTQEHLDHIAEALRDKYATDEEFQASVKRAQEASAKARRGKSLTDEHKQKVSEGLKGKKRPPRTPEQIERYRQAALKRMADPARRAALSRTMKEKGIAPSDEARAKAQATAKRG